MAKFFRKFRFESIDKEKAGKYLKYAIGEIVLIVLGILIAFKISSESEQNKIDRKMDRIFALVKSDLEHGIGEAQIILEYYSKKDSLADLVLSDKATPDMYENRNMRLLTTTMDNFYYRRGGYQNLIQNVDYVDPKLDSLMLVLNDMHTYLEKLTNEVTLRFDNYTYKVEEHWCLKYDWCQFYLDPDLKPAILDYYLHSNEYKNFVLRYKSHASQMKMSATDYIVNAEICLHYLNKFEE